MAGDGSVQALDKALKLLFMFKVESREWGASELAHRLGMAKSTTHRLLRTLVRHELLAQDKATKRFRLGLGALTLGRQAYEGLELRRIAAPVLNQVASLCGETVLLVMLAEHQDRSICVERAPRQSTLHTLFEVGAMGALHASAPSKVLLAYMPEEDIDAVIARGLARFTDQTIVDATALREDLAEIRSRGFAVSFEETDIGVGGVSLPLHDPWGKVIASLGISGPLPRMNRSNINKHVLLLRQGVRMIEAELGYTPGRTATSA
jgi:DNA-binding IclR family transcriptional regulator